MTQQTTDQAAEEIPTIDEAAAGAEALREKLIDAQTPGYQAEFDPDEADRAGAFAEDALSESDALASTDDLADLSASRSPELGQSEEFAQLVAAGKANARAKYEEWKTHQQTQQKSASTNTDQES